MPNCMREGWGQAGVWNSPMGEGQEKAYAVSKRMMTPRHLATKCAVPRNSLNTGGASMGGNPLGFKITLGGSSSVPSLKLNAWMEDEEEDRGGRDLSMSLTGKPIATTGPHMKPAGGGAVFFGDRPMWATSSDNRRKQSAYQASSQSLEPRQTPISLRSPSEQALLAQFAGNSARAEPVKAWRRGFEATPETLTPASSRAVSSAGSAGSGKLRSRSGMIQVEATPRRVLMEGEKPQMARLAVNNVSPFMNLSMASSWKGPCHCHGEGVTCKELLDLPKRTTNSQPGHPGALDAVIRNARCKGELMAGNLLKGSKGTMLGA